MRSRRILLALLPLTLAACPTRPPKGPDAPIVPPQAALDVITITFLATTDIHGHVEAETEHAPRGAGKEVDLTRGGLPLLAGYVANARAAHPGRVVLLDSGDMMQGTLVSNLGEGRAVVRAMNAMGYAAAAVGNHEFDYGPVGPAVLVQRAEDDPRGALKARAAEARYPWLSSNLVDEKGGPFAPGVRAFTVVEVDGVKVGIVGGTSEDTPHTTLAPNLVGVRVLPLSSSIGKAAAEARAAGATVVVAVVHEGGECRKNDRADDLSSCKDDAPIFQLARALPPGTVDAIFAGHTHQAVAHRVAGVPVLQAWSNARAFSRLDLLVDRRSGRPVPDGARIFPPEDVCAAIAHGVGPCRDMGVRKNETRPATYEGREVVADAQVAAWGLVGVVHGAALEVSRTAPIGWETRVEVIARSIGQMAGVGLVVGMLAEVADELRDGIAPATKPGCIKFSPTCWRMPAVIPRRAPASMFSARSSR